MNEFDQLVDELSDAEERLIQGALEKSIRDYPDEKMCRHEDVFSLLARRLSMAERALREKWSFRRYGALARKMDAAF